MESIEDSTLKISEEKDKKVIHISKERVVFWHKMRDITWSPVWWKNIHDGGLKNPSDGKE